MATSPSHRHELRPFRPEHMDGVRWIEEEHARLFGVDKALKEYAAYPSYSGFCDGLFVAAAGIMMPWRGFGEAWAIAGPLIWSHRVFFHRTIQHMLLPLARDMKIRRLQAMVRRDFEVSQRWVKALGFERECVLHRYGIKGEDMIVYAMFLEEVDGSADRA